MVVQMNWIGFCLSVTVFAVGCVSASAETAGVKQVLTPLKPGEITAQGWLRRQIELSLDGLGGHLGEIEPDQMVKPYVTRDYNPANGARGLLGWCAEMAGEFALGRATIGYALGNEVLLREAETRTQAALALQESDGYLGSYRPTDNRFDDFHAWGCHDFYRFLLVEYERTGKADILEALRRGLLWFAKNWSGDRKTDYVGPTIIEPAALVYRLTGDKEILKFAEDYAAWLDQPAHRKYGTFTVFPTGLKAYHVAGLAARMKLPLALSLASGRADWLRSGEKSIVDYMRDVGWQATYTPCADGEWTCRPSCVGESEYCDHVYFMEVFHWLLVLTGKMEYADAIERIVFNAAQGARAKDERTIGYMTSPNQWFATRKSCRHGPEPHYGVYAPNMNAACCPANSIRLYPKYLMRSVMREDASLVFVNYAPCHVKTVIGGRTVEVECKTDYPFDGRLAITVRGDGWTGDLRFRRPAWATRVSLTRGGLHVLVPEDASVLTVPGPWQEETFYMDFGWSPVVRDVYDRDFIHPLKTIEWGALVFSQPVKEIWTKVPRSAPTWGVDESPPQPEEWPWFEVKPASMPVPYAIPNDFDPLTIRVKNEAGDCVPWRKSPVKLVAKLERASSAYPEMKADDERTPVPVSNPVVGDGVIEDVELVPFGCTCLRTTCFPTVSRP